MEEDVQLALADVIKGKAGRKLILEAVKEFDRLGRDAFIQKVSLASKEEYGFGLRKAKDYFLSYKGQFYDSKPVVWYAFLKEIDKFCEDNDIDSYKYRFFGGRTGNTAGGLLRQLGFELASLADKESIEREKKADEEAQEIENDPNRDATAKMQLIEARVGHGEYRRKLIEIEGRCRVTGVEDSDHLRASHIKPWCESTDEERLDGNNGLLLAPHIDHLFDRGYISFTDTGGLMVADDVSGNEDLPEILEMWHIDRDKKYGSFNKKQRKYLAYHRQKIYRGAIRKDQGLRE